MRDINSWAALAMGLVEQGWPSSKATAAAWNQVCTISPASKNIEEKLTSSMTREG